MTHRFPRLEFGALAVAALAAVFGIWIEIGQPYLPLGIHAGRSPLDVPNVVALANGPLRGPERTLLPLTITPGRPARGRVETARIGRAATEALRRRTRPPGPTAPVAPTPRSETVGDSVLPAVVPVTSPRTAPPAEQPVLLEPPTTTPLPTTATVPAVTLPALPDTPPAPALPEAPQAPPPPPQLPGLPPLP